MSTSATILVVDDEQSMLRYIRTVLEINNYVVETAQSGQEAIARIRAGFTPDLVLLDLLMPGLDGLETLQQLRATQPRLKVVVLSCVSEASKIVQAMRLGAFDYLTKPFEKSDLDCVLRQCSGSSEQPIEIAAQGEIEEITEDIFFVSASPAMRKARDQAKLVAAVDVPVLLLGESGVGKEVLAHLIHKMSRRANRTFLKVNCAALPGDLLESELFGYEPGAFTGATRSKPGKFELCDKGTILLDEIGEMPAQLQAKLLHVLQDQQFSRLGGRSTIQVDVRILAATNIDISQAIASKKLREDLYYRLNAFSIKSPPLRERKEEIPLLLKHFMARMAERYGRPPLPITPALVQACSQYHWPGNLRELENFVKRYLVLGQEDVVLDELDTNKTRVPSQPMQPLSAKPVGLKSLVRNLKDEAEMQAIAVALQETGWQRKKAAVRLSISYKALLYKIRQYGLDQPVNPPLVRTDRALTSSPEQEDVDMRRSSTDLSRTSGRALPAL